MLLCPGEMDVGVAVKALMRGHGAGGCSARTSTVIDATAVRPNASFPCSVYVVVCCGDTVSVPDGTCTNVPGGVRYSEIMFDVPHESTDDCPFVMMRGEASK